MKDAKLLGAEMTNGSFKIEDHFNQLLQSVGLNPVDTGGKISFYGQDTIMQSRIRLGASYAIPYMGCAAGAAMIWREKTGRSQDLHIDLRKAIHYIADVPWSTLNGQPYPVPFDSTAHPCPFLDQFYETKDDRLFYPAGFYPHMERAWCDFLGTAPTHARVAEKFKEWDAFELEDKANEAGLVGAVVHTIEEWAATDCGKQLAQTPMIEIEKVGQCAPVPLPAGMDRPLSGLRVISSLEAPKYPPYGLLNDVISGIMSAVGVYAALLRRSREGGSYIVRTSLARCSMWFGTLGFLDPGATQAEGEEHKLIEPDMLDIETPFGHLRRPAPCVEFSETPGRWSHSLSYRGADKPEWLS
jgi:crotonobetainyl-CoA:carnitine CoA-transferase CaiB-like acyl-CoA transferase